MLNNGKITGESYPDSSRSRIVYPVFVVVAAILIYLNGLPSEFIYDDEQTINENVWLSSPRYIPDIFRSNVWGFYLDGHGASVFYRPMQHLINMPMYIMAGPVPWAFRLMAAGFHTCNALLVYFITLRLIGRAGTPAASALAALLFALHPISTSTVATSVTELSFTGFALAAFYAHMRGAPRWAPAGLFFVSALCKETAVVLPVFVIAYDWLCGERRWTPRAFIVRYWHYILAGFAYLGLRGYALAGVALPPRHSDVLSPLEYAINVFPLFAAYLQKLLLPVSLNAFYVFHPAHSVFEWRVMASILVLAAFLSLLYLVRRRPEFAFPLFMIIVSLMPALYIPALGEDTFVERYLYLPSVGYALFIAALAAQVKFRRTVAVLMSLVLIAYAVGTYSRLPVWRDNLSLWRDTVMKSPDGYIPHVKLGLEYKKRGMVREALAEYRKAAEIKPYEAGIYNNIGNVYFEAGRYKEAVLAYQKALGIAPGTYRVRYNLALSELKLGLKDDAIAELRRITNENPEFRPARGTLDRALRQEGQ